MQPISSFKLAYLEKIARWIADMAFRRFPNAAHGIDAIEQYTDLTASGKILIDNESPEAPYLYFLGNKCCRVKFKDGYQHTLTSAQIHNLSGRIYHNGPTQLQINTPKP